MKKIIGILFILIFQNKLFASSCCGGGASSSLIILGDNSEEYSIGSSYRNDLGQTDSSGWATFNRDNTTDRQVAFNLQYQRQLSERYQAAIKSSVIQKNVKKVGQQEVTTGLGDIDVQGTFEVLPEYTYSPWKPRGFIYGKVTIPMSRSFYDSKSTIKSDVRGTGLFASGLGSLFSKRISNLSLKTSLEWQHFFGKSYEQTTVSDYDKILVPMGVSYAFDPRPIALGAGASWSYQFPKKLSGTQSGISHREYFWELSAFVNWVISRENSLGLSYADSTLVGKNISSPLYRSLSLTYTSSTPL